MRKTADFTSSIKANTMLKVKHSILTQFENRPNDKLMRYLAVAFLCVCSLCNYAQSKQKVRGRVIDKDTKQPLIGANVYISQDPPLGANCDEEGYFLISDVPIGRITLQVSMVGYEGQQISNLLLTPGKELYMDILMNENIQELESLTVRPSQDKTKTINDMLSVSSRTFDVEEAGRYAGNRNDIARMVSNYAGVAAPNDGRNDIVIRGNSPTSLLWRCEGIDIPSPNHFSSFGATGGPVSMINYNNLSTSDFIISAFPAMFGNAIGGVFDLELRKGTSFKREYMAQIGFTGFELGAEGFFKRNHKSTFLVNYRYSVLGLINKLGVSFGTGTAIPDYQDLTTTIYLPTKKAGVFKIFGITGTSSIHFEPQDVNSKNFYSTENLFNSSSTFIVGINHTLNLSKDSYLNSTIAYSNQKSNVLIDSISNNTTTQGNFFWDVIQNQLQNKVSFHSAIHKKIDRRNKIVMGFLADLNSVNYGDSIFQSKKNDWFKYRDINRGGLLLYRTYLQYEHRFLNGIRLLPGFYFQHFRGNNSFEPRLAVQYDLSNTSNLSLGFGMHSQMQPLIAYYQSFNNDDGTTSNNENLKFTRSNHLALSYNKRLPNNFRLKLETYYQHLYNIPTTMASSSFSLINSGADFNFETKPNLVNNGLGRNYGVETTIEKFFSKNYYFLLTASVFQSKYKASDGKWRNTAFNNEYVINFLGGYEFKVGKGNIGVDIKTTLAGGKYITPIDEIASKANNYPVYFEDSAFSKKQDVYFRHDVKLSFKIGIGKTYHQWLLDIQNVADVKNLFREYYDVNTKKIVKTYQLGFYIVFQYKILF